MPLRRRLVALTLLALVACVRRIETAPVGASSAANRPDGAEAASKRAEPPTALPKASDDRTLRLDPIEIKSSPAERALGDLTDEELFRIGTSAMGGGDNVKAALHFERLAEQFPESPRRPQALYNAGILQLKMKEHALAARRFADAARAFGPVTEQGIDARFRLADALYFLGDVDGAVQTLERIGQETSLSAKRRAEAEVKRGICLYNSGRLEESERVLRSAIEEIREHLRDEVHDGFLPSQAEFYLGEVNRQQFVSARFDPGGTEASLLAALEAKAQLLLDAQNHYVRCMRHGHGEWAVASGYRVGELYQLFHKQMTESPLPADMDAERAEVYREEVQKKVRILVEKAVHVYEKTLATAERVGATNAFVPLVRTQLDRLRSYLRETAESKAPSAAPVPAGKKPS
jgi:TolA-binding protein